MHFRLQHICQRENDVDISQYKVLKTHGTIGGNQSSILGWGKKRGSNFTQNQRGNQPSYIWYAKIFSFTVWEKVRGLSFD